jgi:hypothetical protein
MIYRAQGKIILKFLVPLERMIDSGWEKGQAEFEEGTDISGRQVWFCGRCNRLNTSKGYVSLTIHRPLKLARGRSPSERKSIG